MAMVTSPDLVGKAPGGRKLFAVVYADMVGYSRLIGFDDIGTLDRLQILRRGLIEPNINEYGGRIVQTGGDSLLIVFDSIDGAVRCMVSIQQRVPDYDRNLSPIRFRVGIDISDAIADGTDLHGDGVNIAARLQAECPPGEICVSRAIRDHTHGRLNLTFEDLGTLSFKNIARPVESFVLKLEKVPAAGWLGSVAASVAMVRQVPSQVAQRWRTSRRLLVTGVASMLTIGLVGSDVALEPFAGRTARTFHGTQRTALIVGNGRYKDLSPLANAERDAEMVSIALEARGFRVIKKIDADRDALVRAITDFQTTLSVVGGIGLFYYAGSAAHIGGADIILPVDATKDPTKMTIKGGINLTLLSADIETRITKKVADNGSAVIYSASKGQEAWDGPPGENSPFTRAFLAALDHEEDELGDTFRRIRQMMQDDLNVALRAGRQIPYFEDWRTARFYFNKPEKGPAGMLRILVFDSCRDNPFELDNES